MLIIEPLKGEKIDRLTRRYKKKCDKTKLPKKVRARLEFVKKSEKRRKEITKATKRDAWIRDNS